MERKSKEGQRGTYLQFEEGLKKTFGSHEYGGEKSRCRNIGKKKKKLKLTVREKA